MNKICLLAVVFALIGGAGSTMAQDNCESLRASIEAKIRANGVQKFTVTVVDANAAVIGQMVGTCGLDSRRIVYERQDGAVPGATARPAQPAPESRERVLTECRDGSVHMGGDCAR